jgi:TRAP-type transport system periplasmic protein
MKKIGILCILLFMLIFVFNFLALAQTATLKFGHAGPLQYHPNHIAATHFKELLEERTDGRIEVEIFPQGQLGGERELAESVIMGTVDITIACNGPLANWVPEFAVFDMPFLFDDLDHAYRVVDGEVGEEFDQKLLNQGMKCMGYGANGMCQFTNNVKPIVEAADMKGLKFRVMETKIWLATMNALGAIAVPLPFTELYSALEQGVVDGQTNPPLAARSLKLHEVQKYISLTNHSVIMSAYLMNPKKFNSFSSEDQKIIEDVFKESIKYQREMLNIQDETDIQSLEDNGMQVIIDIDRESFQNATKGVPEIMKQEIPLELIERIKNM